MRFIKNKKGFTLVELLVAITILGIIMVIALPQLSNIQNNNRTTKYRKYADSMLSSAKLYTDSYTEDMFGNNKSGCVDIPYDDMKERNLLKDIKVDGSSCKSNKSYIRVRKANDHYFYEVSISCKDKDGKVVYEELLPENACDGLGPDEEGPKIIITPNELDWTKGTNQKVAVKIWDEYGMLENAKIKLTWTKNGTAYGDTITYDYKNKRYDAPKEEEALSHEFEIPQGETGIFKLTVTPIDVRDSLGNYHTASVTSGEYKLDNTPPTVPTSLYMYKWTDNSGAAPTNSTGLTAYSENTWTNKYVFTYASGSSDSHSKGVYYQYKTTGAVGEQSDKKASYKSLDKQGTSTIAWRACDKLGNCSAYMTAKTAKIDITRPTIDSIKNSSNGKWTNTDVTIEAEASDTGGSGMSAIYYYYDNDSTYRDDWDLTKTPSKVKGKWSAERNNIVSVVAIDVAGNITTAATNVKIDKTAPNVPTVEMFKWKDNSTRPSSADHAGLDTYVNDTWSNRSIFTYASGGADSASGLAKYQFNATGTTTNATNADGRSRSVEAQGLSYVQYRACDNAGNCSDYTGNYIIKIDKTPPTCSVSGGNAAWINAKSSPGSRTITATCTDTMSDCATAPFSHTYNNNINTTTAGAAGDGAGGTVYDNAGNSANCAADQTVKIDKNAPTLSSITNSSDNVWTSGSVIIRATAADTGGSGLAHTKYYYDAAGDRLSDWDSDSTSTNIKGTWVAQRDQRVYLEVTDTAGNVTSGYDAGVVKIDKTDPVITGISNPKNNTATVSGLQVTLSGYDSHSGIAKWQYKEGSGSWTDISSSAYSPYVDTFTAERSATTFYYRLCDVVGNCSSASSTIVHIVNPCASGYTTIGSYGEYGTCSATCGPGKKYRDVYLVSTFDNSISCGKRSTQEEADCNVAPCECAHSYGGGYNSISGNYKNYFDHTASSSYSFSNCSHSHDADGNSNGHHSISKGQVIKKAQCIHCAHPAGWTWCPCAYGSNEC